MSLSLGKSSQDSSGWSNVKAFVSQTWFIGTVGAVLWVILFIIALLLWRKRKRKRQEKVKKNLTPRSPKGKAKYLNLNFSFCSCP